MRKVCVVVTARPSYSRIRTALLAIRDHPDLELQLVVAASALLDRYGSAIQFIERDQFPIAARVQMVLEGVRQMRGTSVNQVANVHNVLVCFSKHRDKISGRCNAVLASYGL